MLDRVQLVSLCATRVGARSGAQLATFIFEWELAVKAHGRPISSEEFAEWWWHSRATTYNRLRDFRRAFPQLGPKGLPSDLMRPLLARLEQEGREPAVYEAPRGVAGVLS